MRRTWSRRLEAAIRERLQEADIHQFAELMNAPLSFPAAHFSDRHFSFVNTVVRPPRLRIIWLFAVSKQQWGRNSEGFAFSSSAERV
jgi:hypothetical protein